MRNHDQRLPAETIARELRRMCHVYFMHDHARTAIRIGKTDDLTMNADGVIFSKRIHTHVNSRLQFMAIIAAGADFETELQDNHFRQYRIEDDSGSISFYRYDAVAPYVERLLDYHLATNNLQKAALLMPADYRVLRPNYKPKLRRPLVHRSFISEAERSIERQQWQTPKLQADMIRTALGGHIDLDPCTELEANERVKANWGFTEYMNGLNHPWIADTVYMNPPYRKTNTKMEVAFVNHFHEEFAAGHFDRGIICLNLQSVCANWFKQTVAQHAMLGAIYESRVPFHGPASKKTGKSPAYGASRNGTIFLWYGDDPTNFIDVFAGCSYFTVFDVRHLNLDAMRRTNGRAQPPRRAKLSGAPARRLVGGLQAAD